MDTTKIVRGDDLMLFDSNKKSIAFATSHSLTLTSDVVEISCKDSGIWKDAKVNKLGWEITSDNLFCEQEYNKLMAIWKAGEPIEVYFGMKTGGTPSTSVETGYYNLYTDSNEELTGVSIGVNFAHFEKLSAIDKDTGKYAFIPAVDGSLYKVSNGKPFLIGSLNEATSIAAVFSIDGGSLYTNTPVIKPEMQIIPGSGGSSTDGIDSPTDAWTANTTGLWGGKALITNISVNAASGDNATYSITLQGIGEYKEV